MNTEQLQRLFKAWLTHAGLDDKRELAELAKAIALSRIADAMLAERLRHLLLLPHRAQLALPAPRLHGRAAEV